MNPTLSSGEEADVLRYKAPIVPGDIIVFPAPTSVDRQFIQRVIAGPGQAVEIVNHSGPSGRDIESSEVRVDGQTLDEPYAIGVTECSRQLGCMFTVPGTQDPPVPDQDPSPISIQPPNYDNSACQTTACYFVMGDNRQNSSDSRQGWLVPVDNIIGYINVSR